MRNFSITVDSKKFDIVLPVHFDEVAERVANAFDFAEEDSEDGMIPRNRQGLMINEPLAVVSETPEVEMYIEDQLKRKLSQHFTKAIGRKCQVTGVFGPDRARNGKFETAFEITFIALV